MSIEVQYETLYEKRYLTSVDDSMLDKFIMFYNIDDRSKSAVRAYTAYYRTHSLEQIAAIAELESADELGAILTVLDASFKASLEADKQAAQEKQEMRARRSARTGKLRESGRVVMQLHSVAPPQATEQSIPEITTINDDALILTPVPETATKGVCEDLLIEERNMFTGTLSERNKAKKFCEQCLAKRACLEVAMELYDPRNAGVFVGRHGKDLVDFVKTQKNILASQREELY